MEHELGPLPEPFMELHRELTPVVYSAWADQMREYALAEVRKAVAAECERCAKVCESIGAYEEAENVHETAHSCAYQIRLGY